MIYSNNIQLVINNENIKNHREGADVETRAVGRRGVSIRATGAVLVWWRRSAVSRPMPLAAGVVRNGNLDSWPKSRSMSETCEREAGIASDPRSKKTEQCLTEG